jgi:hypothetical protein
MGRNLGDVGLHARIIIKWKLENYNMTVLDGFICLKTDKSSSQGRTYKLLRTISMTAHVLLSLNRLDGLP